MPQNRKNITIIGTGLTRDDISPRALKAIEDANVLIGGRRQLSFFPQHSAEKIETRKDAAALVKGLKQRLKRKRVVVLASGDPNFFGIASLFYKNFDKNKITVIPSTTAFQWAFARIKEPWDDAVFISVHGRDMSALDKILLTEGTFVVYCDNNKTPAKVASYLTSKDKKLGACRAWVFDRLGEGDEKIQLGVLNRFQKLLTSSLAMMIIKKEKAAEKPALGIPDKEFYHQGGMITKRDIRILSLSRLNLRNKQVLWDIGAGSGSISIEAASIYPSLSIYAVEEREGRFKELKKNIQKFKLPNIHPVHGRAPDVLKSLPSPDSVFIGGTGGRLEQILRLAKRRVPDGGHVVINCVKMETLTFVQKLFKKWQWQYNITAVQISHLSSDTSPEIFKAENPVLIVQGMKGKNK
jgi:precorrin-6Y C5,15-methyltransferase (decarboxylating)